MFDIGFLELILIAVISLLVLGPERLPKAARAAGSMVGKAKRMVSQFSQEIDKQMKAEELREKIKKEGDGIGLNDIQRSVQEALDKANDMQKQSNMDILTPQEQDSVPSSSSVSNATSIPSPPTASTLSTTSADSAKS